ncbi:hypothetical protein QJS66_02540 [Kocuria rhizophila]|nr:hypothetical protein QJS66_02540 [Kocuria rhizophila]
MSTASTAYFEKSGTAPTAGPRPGPGTSLHHPARSTSWATW